MTTAIPKHEDIPLLLAWIKPAPDASRRCMWNKQQCRRPATFLAESYEDEKVIEAAFKQGLPYKEVEDRVWKHTVQQQMLGHFPVCQIIALCTPCLLDSLMHFLATTKDKELREMIAGMSTGGYTLVQWHWLSYPEMGLVSPVRIPKTPQEFVTWIQAGETTDWKLRE